MITDRRLTLAARNAIEDSLPVSRPVAGWVSGLLSSREIDEITKAPRPTKNEIRNVVADCLTRFAEAIRPS